MYLSNKILIEGSNAARELSKVFSTPQQNQWNALDYFVGYLKHKKDNIMLTYHKPTIHQFVTAPDVKFAQDKQDRRSISGNISTIGGTIISWSSKAQ